jgi:hypothetical protein
MIASPLKINVEQERLSNGYGQLAENVEQKSAVTGGLAAAFAA